MNNRTYLWFSGAIATTITLSGLGITGVIWLRLRSIHQELKKKLT